MDIMERITAPGRTSRNRSSLYTMTRRHQAMICVFFLCLLIPVIFLFNVIASDWTDAINLSGHPLSRTLKKKSIRPGELLQKLALDLSDLKGKMVEDKLFVREILARFLKANENKEGIRSVVQDSIKVGVGAALDDQKKLILKQNEILAEQQREIQNLKASLAVQSTEISTRQGPDEFGFLSHGDPKNWKQRSFSLHGTFGFLPYSTYRLSPRKFATPALAALRLHDSRKIEGCFFHNNDGTVVNGTLSFQYMEEHHGKMYEVVVAMCNLESDTGTTGGFLEAKIDFESIVLFNEIEPVNGASPLGYEKPDESKLPNHITLCGPPMFSKQDARAVYEWMEWNRVVVGVNRTIFYTMQAIDKGLSDILSKYIESGRLEITDMKRVPFDAWYFSQGVFMHDCIFRSAFDSRWVVFADLDEYIDTSPPHTVRSLLDDHADVAWLSQQARWWSLDFCTKPNVSRHVSLTDGRSTAGDDDADVFAIERLVYRWPHDYCMGRDKYPKTELCLGHYGHRKVIVNPRKVELVFIHGVHVPKDDVYHFNAKTEMRHNHYQGVNSEGRRARDNGKYVPGNKQDEHLFCSKENETVDSWWALDYSVAAVAASVRSSPLE